MVPTPETTVREIVADDFRTASVFEKYGIDFCCGAQRSLGEACRERGLTVDEVAGALAAVKTAGGPEAPRFSTWDPPALVSYIVANHHGYVKAAIPPLLEHTRKIEAVHGDRHPELKRVASIFAAVAEEMDSHMFKEERILFPFIVEMANAAAAGLCELSYWRERNHEVDFVVKAGRRLVAIEVKSGRALQAHAGTEAFAQAFKVHRALLVGGDGISLEDFLSRPVVHWIGP